MSYTFDTMQHGLQVLGNKLQDDAQAQDILHYMKCIVNRLHDADHDQEGALNRVAGRFSRALELAIKYEDDSEREMWLKVASKE